ncbi:protein FAR-RED ELONGATED HYPOCOTYL 1 isoform X1 [Fagus crenata]
MNENNHNTSEFDSFLVNKALKNGIVDLNKKRKLHAEQLGLPTPKHKCWDRSFASEAVTVFDKSPEAESFCTHIINGKTEGATMVDDESEPESAKGSNSFGGDSDSAMSTYDEAKLQPEYTKPYLFNMPSTSSDYTHYSLGSSKDTLASLSGGHPPTHRDGLQASEEEHREFGNHVDYNCLEYGESIEQCTDKELEDILYSNGVNPNTYVLSSGRWEVNQDAQSGTRKPTIDQEFEQYFSMLML